MCICRYGGRKKSWITPYSPVYLSIALAVTIWLVAMPQILQRFAIRTRTLTVRGSEAAELSATDDVAAADDEHGLVSAEPTTATASPAPKYPGAAFVTLAGGDASARNLVALLQSLRDVGTTLPIIVLLARGGLGSAACQDHDWKKKVGRPDVSCLGPDTIGEEGSRGGRATRAPPPLSSPLLPRAAEEIISPQYVEILTKLGAEIRVIPWLPRTKYTEGIPGGKESFWGYSLNRLV